MQCAVPGKTVTFGELSLKLEADSGYVLVTGLDVTQTNSVGTVEYKDYEGTIVTYAFLPNGEIPFAMNSSQGTITVVPDTSLMIDFGESKDIPLIASADDQNGRLSYGPVKISVCDLNDPPIIPDSLVQVIENTPAGGEVGLPLAYLEQDATDEVIFTGGGW